MDVTDVGIVLDEQDYGKGDYNEYDSIRRIGDYLPLAT